MKEMEDKISQKVVVTNERIIEEYAKIAFLDPKKLFNSDGTLKNINEMDDDVAAVVAGLESEQLLEGRGEKKEAIGTLKKIKFVDKKGALDSLAKINSLFKDEVTVRHTIEDYLEDE